MSFVVMPLCSVVIMVHPAAPVLLAKSNALEGQPLGYPLIRAIRGFLQYKRFKNRRNNWCSGQVSLWPLVLKLVRVNRPKKKEKRWGQRKNFCFVSNQACKQKEVGRQWWRWRLESKKSKKQTGYGDKCTGICLKGNLGGDGLWITDIYIYWTNNAR